MPGIAGVESRLRVLSGMPPLAPREEERAVASPDGRLPAAGYADLTAEHARPRGRGAWWREFRCRDQETSRPNRPPPKVADTATAAARPTDATCAFSWTKRPKGTSRRCRQTSPPRLAGTPQTRHKAVLAVDSSPEAPRADN